MLSFRSIGLFRAWIAAWPDERRSSRLDKIAAPRFTLGTIGDGRLETIGAVEGTTGTAMLGDGGGRILAALPMPLGSLIELLTPPMLPGPCGIPLTPASPAPCARDLIGAIKLATNAKAKNVDLPNIDRTPVRVPNERTRLPFLMQA
jgi:hypothetical protein